MNGSAFALLVLLAPSGQLRKRPRAMAGVCAGFILLGWMMVFAAVLGSVVFDLTWVIVGVALPYMQGTFSSTTDQIAWVMTGFIVSRRRSRSQRPMRGRLYG